MQFQHKRFNNDFGYDKGHGVERFMPFAMPKNTPRRVRKLIKMNQI
jgi:hypothetical protein